jgi:hypothetical protein
VRRALPWALALAILGGCRAEPPERFELRVTASSDEGFPLDGLDVQLDGVHAGTTDGDGVLEVALPGPEGRRVTVTVDAPAKFRGGRQTRSVVLEHLLRRGESRAAPLEVAARFAPEARSYVLLVDVGAPGLAVELFGVPKAVTNSEGVAMVMVPGQPGDDLPVRVSRGARADLTPPYLSHTFTLPDHAGVCVLDGRFTVVKKPVRGVHRPMRL